MPKALVIIKKELGPIQKNSTGKNFIDAHTGTMEIFKFKKLLLKHDIFENSNLDETVFFQ